MLFWTGGCLRDFLHHQFYFLVMSNTLIGWCLKQEGVSLCRPALRNVAVNGRSHQFLSSRCLLTVHVKASLASLHQPQGGPATLEDRCYISKTGMSLVRKETIKRRVSFYSGHSHTISPVACSLEWHLHIPSLGASPSCLEPWEDVFWPKESSEWQNAMRGSQNSLAAPPLCGSPGPPHGPPKSAGCESEAGHWGPSHPFSCHPTSWVYWTTARTTCWIFIECQELYIHWLT